MGRPPNREQRRREIRKALLRVMAKSGYERATVADIAREANLSPGLLHYHFKNKQEILLNLIERMYAFRKKSLTIGTALPPIGGPAVGGSDQRERSGPAGELETFIDTYLDLPSADPDALAAWTAMGAEALRDPEVGACFEAILVDSQDHLRQILKRGARSGAFICHDIDAATAAILSLIQGYFFLAATAGRLIPKGSAAPSAYRMALGLLTESPPEKRKR